MIEIPVWFAILLLAALPCIGFLCYWYGWRLHARFSERVVRIEHIRFGDRPMTTEERHAANEAFEHMDKALDAMRRVFDR